MLLTEAVLKYLIHCKNLCNCHNVSPSSTTIKEKKIDMEAKEIQGPGESDSKVDQGV
jgi:hypothetical protein